MTEDEVAAFVKEEDILKMDTPEQEGKPADRPWGSFTILNKGLANTAPTNKPERGPDGRRARPKEKGLRKLSQRAYEIVLNLRSASYK